MKKLLLKIFKIFVVVLIFLFKLIDVIYSIDYEGAVAFFKEVFGIGEVELSIDYNAGFEITSLTDFFNIYFFPIFLTTSFVLSLLGTFILTRRKSLYAAAGLLLAFIIPKENIFWGSIKDKSTGNIIPFAVIRAYKLDGKGKKEYVGQTVADVDGRYSLYLSKVEPGYMYEVEAPGYVSFSQNIEGFETKGKAFNITEDVVLAREESKKGKRFFNYNKPKLYKFLMWTVYINSIVYFLTFVYYLIAWPWESYAWITIIIFTYSVFRNTKVIKQRFFAPKGRLLDVNSKNALSGVEVSFFKDGQKLESHTSDSHGIIKSSFKEGKYDVSIGKSGFKVKSPVPWRIEGDLYFVRIKVDKEGYFMRDVLLENKGEHHESKSDNPFS